jgi:UDP-2,3-diacylglucosamine pyrophosphatase LpxH
MKNDIIIISDLHLGSHICQSQKLLRFLQSIELRTQHLIINGDLFDNWNFTRLLDTHWQILKTIRKVSEKIKVTWIAGNHDGPADIVSYRRICFYKIRKNIYCFTWRYFR